MFKAAKRFILNQRIEELEKSIRNWPDSPKLINRQRELAEKVRELEELESQK